MEDLSRIPVLILAGGLGTRISEETQGRPKPMVEIGETPILIHIMRWYYSQGFNDFVILGGYKVWEIKSYFLNYEYRTNHLSLDHRVEATRTAKSFGERRTQERWRVRVIDTGMNAQTGSRVFQGLEILEQEDPGFHTFALTYGDGLSDVDLKAELAFHREAKGIGTVLGVSPPARFGELKIENSNQFVTEFSEKPQTGSGTINGGYFFFERTFKKYLSAAPATILEQTPLSKIAKEKKLAVYRHPGFWQPMDTLRDKNYLETLWTEGKAPWKV
jgi:glucose-1-phosphate cytidylyltransferase